MARMEKAPRRAEPREPFGIVCLDGERLEGSPTTLGAQVLAARMCAQAHLETCLKSTGVHALVEMVLESIYAHQATALACCGEGAR